MCLFKIAAFPLSKLFFTTPICANGNIASVNHCRPSHSYSKIQTISAGGKLLLCSSAMYIKFCPMNEEQV